jgi:hypothetical protein
MIGENQFNVISGVGLPCDARNLQFPGSPLQIRMEGALNE